MSNQQPPQQPPEQAEPQPPPAEKSGRSAGAIASLVGAGLLLGFMLQNRQDSPVHFFFWRVDLPAWYVIRSSALLGDGISRGLGDFSRRRRRVARRRERRQRGR